ncbi:FAD binding domain-containing protein [Glonium stellatum]|uniref:FAD binding domain-containing protein n=1 Tax=Glonium stellatum TaxID=574774 RepID=A0A8E2EYA8_9PEZI|nr:FAD binding domain-containing protein [Glonium stellatum]
MWYQLNLGATVLLSLGGCFNAEYIEPTEFDPQQALVDQGINFEGYLDERQQLLSNNNTCISACSKLSLIFESQVTHQGSPEHELWTDQFWSQQQSAVKPSCIFQPKTAFDISAVVLVSRWSKCPFAVKSGGHAAFAGASNADGGITIDLSAMNAIELTPDQKVAKIGPGNIWYTVYSTLEKVGLTVVGGRVADIGVGGLTLGGGISFFSGAYGWACDNVVNYEVVVASGEILNVNYTSYPDLYWALRGGGNNFGIVTRFDMETYPQGELWAGSRTYDLKNHSQALINAFVNFGNNPDDLATTWVAFVHYQGDYLVSTSLVYHQPIIDPPIFDEFKAIPSLADSTKIRSLSDMTMEVNATSPKHMREMYWTHTFKLDARLANFIVKTFLEEIEPVKNTVGYLPAPVLQAITKTALSHMAKNGGNSLPITAEEGPYMNLIFATMWMNEEEDEAIIGTTARVMQKVVAKAKEWNVYNEYIYMNYASQYQDVLHSYGEENYDRLVNVATKYDPERIFQELQPGYFKFGGAPTKNTPGL